MWRRSQMGSRMSLFDSIDGVYNLIQRCRHYFPAISVRLLWLLKVNSPPVCHPPKLPLWGGVT